MGVDVRTGGGIINARVVAMGIKIRNHKTNGNKPQRDEQKAKELRDLKQENRTLKKQLGKLRKQLAKLVDKHGLELPDCSVQEPEEEFVPEPEPLSETAKCPKCGGPISGLTLSSMDGLKQFVACKNKHCLWRKKVV